MPTRLAAVFSCLLFIPCFCRARCDEKPTDPKGRAIIAKAIAAHGGPQRVARLNIMLIKGQMKATLPGVGAVTGTWEQTWHLPDQVKDVQELSINGTKFLKVQVLNGTGSWASINGQTHRMEEAERKQMEAEMYPETLDKLTPLVKPGLMVSSIPSIQISHKTALGIKTVSAGHAEVKLYFDQASGLLVKRENSIHDETGKAVRLELYYSDYKDFDGLKLYQKAVAYLDGKLFEEFTVTDVNRRAIMTQIWG